MSFWIRTKTNRLKAPVRKKLDVPDTSGNSVNWCGDPVAKVGDYVLSGNSVGAGTVGRVVSLSNLGQSQPGFDQHYSSPKDWWAADVETLDGKISGGWLWAMTVIPYTAVQEVKDFYIADGRPQRIKVSW